MKRSERLLELIDLLGGHSRVTLQEIVRRFDVSERTVYRDLADVGRQIAPVVREEGGYRLIEGARIRPLALTAEERRLLTAALALPPLRDQPALSSRLARLAEKLRAAAGPGPDGPPSLAVDASDRTGRLAPDLLRTVEEGIDDSRTLRLTYHSLSAGETRDRRADPYAVVHRGGAWYLVAHCHDNAAPRTFRLDRVRKARLTDAPFRRPPTFRLDDYLANAWEIYRGDRLHEVTLRFAPDVAPIVLDGHHHASEQVEELDDGSAIYRVTLSHLEEIARWVLGFGGKVVVIEPEELRGRVVEMARGVVASVETELPSVDSGEPS